MINWPGTSQTLIQAPVQCYGFLRRGVGTGHRHVSNGPLSGSQCLMHPASQSGSLSYFPGRAAPSVVREEKAGGTPDVRPWALQRGSQEYRRWQERTVRGPWWHVVTCSPSRDRVPFSSSRAGSSRGPRACVPFLRFKQASWPSAFLRLLVHSLVSNHPDA